ncbi:MAG: hypothetical protein ACD_62C00362G0002 [uncultured bacterium]|nr:MAG: hypothetical protein ACD_62C00362G0002 [uncultured bacterium]
MLSIRNFYDVIIVGGGINGCGIARDLALRGVSCLLVEKNDFAAGTSGASSGMIHGGVRYLLSDARVTRLSCLDSGIIQKMAPHLLFRIPFLITVYDQPKRSGLSARLYLEAAEAYFRAYDTFASHKNAQKHTRLSPSEVLALEPRMAPDRLIGGVTFDEWGIDVPRLCVANVLDAIENGAHACNHTTVTGVGCTQGRVTSVVLKDDLSRSVRRVSCKMLVNATGPWSPQFAKLFGVAIPMRPTKGIHVVFDRKLSQVAIVAQAIDGREVFLLPYENTSILGTTDDDFFGDLDDQRSTHDEVQYLLDAIDPVFPDIRKARVINTFSGVRPTLYERNAYEDDLSREHEVIDHAKRDQLEGVVSLIGGKLASYRIMAKETADLVAKKLGVRVKSTTHERCLPGGDELPNAKSLARDYHVSPQIVSRLIYRHGSRAIRILELIRKDASLGALVCSCEPVTVAEVQYVVTHELARTLSDVRRRTRLTMGPCQGTNCLTAASAVLAGLQHKGPQEHEDMMRDFVKEWWWNRACVLDGDGLKQEELFQALHHWA